MTGRRGNLLVVLAAALLLLLGLWVASQGGVAARLPAAMFAVIYQALDSLPVLAALWLAAAGYGYPLRRGLFSTSRDGALLQVIAGMAMLLLLCWLSAWLSGLGTLRAWGICGAGVALLVFQVAMWQRRHPGQTLALPELPWTLALAAPAVGLLVVAAACPPGVLWNVEARGYDVLSYHLQVPREWLGAGAMRGLAHNVYSYLPNLVEAGYAQIGAMRGSMYAGIYTAQFFHASLAIVAAVALGRLVARVAGAAAGALAAAVFLAVPWTIITGSLAYDEMAALAFGAGAFLVVFEPGGIGWRGAALAGFLAGAATLAKLTAGPMIALPVGLVLLARLHPTVGGSLTWRSAVRMAAVAALAGLLTLSPYLIRNAIWTGNPVFPFATDLLGRGHWTADLVQRWRQGHGLTAGKSAASQVADGLTELDRRWLRNAGYGAIGGATRGRSDAAIEVRDVARFDHEGGVPLLWAVVLLGVVVAVRWPSARRLAAGMLLCLGVQVGFWVLATHHQSRFLLPTLLPGCALAGLAAGWLRQRVRAGLGFWAFGLVAVALVLILTILSFRIFLEQTPSRLSPHQLIGLLPTEADLQRAQPEQFPIGDHPINHLVPPEGKALLVADVSSLLYIRRPIVYHSAFDADPLGQLLRRSQGEPAQVTAGLRQEGVTHVWVNWSELDRLRGTYGYDPDVTPTKLRELAQRWRQVYAQGHIATLHELP